MAHLLLLEIPGGNDLDIFDAALAQGHTVSFFTSDSAYYAKNGILQRFLDSAKRIVEITPFNYDELELRALEVHHHDPIDGLLCLIDIRMPDAAQLAKRLNLPFLNPDTARNMRDKYTVRTILANQGIRQPEFSLATSNQELRATVDTMGLPLIVKPSDGYGSQNIAIFLTEKDLNPFIDPLDHYLPCHTDYGFGVKANDRLLVERYTEGQLIGCDTFTQNGVHIMLGINEKMMYPTPSCAIKGSCFPVDHYDIDSIQTYLFSILNALNFNDGVAHTEILLTPEGPLLVEVNPRLVGAKIPRLLNISFDRSIHEDVINLHLGQPLSEIPFRLKEGFSVSRWIISEQTGILDEVILPDMTDADVRFVEILKKSGDSVGYPYQNADRIGYVMTYGNTQALAEELAEDYISKVSVKLAGQ